VVVTIFPIYDLVRRVAGPDADVVLLHAPPGTPGSQAPAPDRVAGAQVGIVAGLGLDDAEEKRIRDRAPKARIVKVGDRVPTLEDSNGIDPHVWLDPARARLIVKAVGEELARTDRGHAIAYRQRATELDAALDTLDKEVEAKTSLWKRREFSTDDANFGYFADRYHLKISTARSAAPDAVSVPTDALDPIGGTPEMDSYEKMIRFNLSAFDLRSH